MKRLPLQKSQLFAKLAGIKIYDLDEKYIGEVADSMMSDFDTGYTAPLDLKNLMLTGKSPNGDAVDFIRLFKDIVSTVKSFFGTNGNPNEPFDEEVWANDDMIDLFTHWMELKKSTTHGKSNAPNISILSTFAVLSIEEKERTQDTSKLFDKVNEESRIERINAKSGPVQISGTAATGILSGMNYKDLMDFIPPGDTEQTKNLVNSHLSSMMPRKKLSSEIIAGNLRYSKMRSHEWDKYGFRFSNNIARDWQDPSFGDRKLFLNAENTLAFGAVPQFQGEIDIVTANSVLLNEKSTDSRILKIMDITVCQTNRC